ncbi:F-box/LRR-repeat protein 5-like [Clytia hemisphaerica]|uniref:F-box/LRR-repeat protein 5 n=1 Tax=Clytia hemisphaerica TaxID=252671 RepID=A0A7M5V8F6_9CNID
MAAVKSSSENVFSFEEIDVFTVPHNRMKKILLNVSNQTKKTDFNNQQSFGSLLKCLSSSFLELKHHEEIENKCIMKVLKRKLQGESLKKLLIHLHAHSHISDILKLVRQVEKDFQCGVNQDLKILGSTLNDSLQEFYDEYVPHMKEEEQVFQPMLMEMLPLNELHHIQQVVLQLHHFDNIGKNVSQTLSKELEKILISKPSDDQNEDIDIVSEGMTIEKLPIEMLTVIFSYLGPRDLGRCAQVSKKWNSIAYTGSFWSTLHPRRWAHGDWTFGKQSSSDDCNCDCEPNYELITFSSEEKDNYSSGSCSESDSEETQQQLSSKDDPVQREVKVLNGIGRYLLPRIGASVKTLVLECSKAITNGLLFRMLSQCRNLEYLDVSQTIVSDLGLMGLFKDGCRNMKYLDVSGCRGITDKTLIKLSTALGSKKSSSNACSNCTCFQQQRIVGDKSPPSPRQPKQLEILRLSGCFKITDAGLRALTKHGCLQRLRHLDLSGCINVTSAGIENLVTSCPNLDLNELSYCDNIETDYDYSANGCQNQGCLNRVCCRTGGLV